MSVRPGPATPKVQPLWGPSSQLADGALVLAAREGEPWAQEALFRRYVPIAYGQAWRLLPHEDPEDLAQEALVKALTNLHQLEAPQAFGAWLATIVVRLATTRLRRHRLLGRLGLRGPDPTPSLDQAMAATGDPEAAAALQEVYRQLAHFPAEERVALVLQRVEGLELSEIAARMGLSLATVKRRLASGGVRLEALSHG